MQFCISSIELAIFPVGRQGVSDPSGVFIKMFDTKTHMSSFLSIWNKIDYHNLRRIVKTGDMMLNPQTG